MRPRLRPRKQPKSKKNSVVDFCRRGRKTTEWGFAHDFRACGPSRAPVAMNRACVAPAGGALLLELLDGGLPPRCCRGSWRRPAFAAFPGSNRKASRFDALRWTPRPGRVRAAPAPRLRCLTIRWLALIGRWRGHLPRPQCGRTPLLDGPRIA